MNQLKEAPEILLREGDSQLIIYTRCFQDLKLDDFFTQIEWRQNKIRVFGKEYDEPRLTAWFGPAYKYSGIQWRALEMPEFLMKIAHRLRVLCGMDFNSVLMNYYRAGSDSMGWHSDNEHEMDTRCIASVSLGASRLFALRKGRSGKSLRTHLHHGDLLVMNNLQEGWQHCIPKVKGNVGPRLNMTFRYIRS